MKSVKVKIITLVLCCIIVSAIAIGGASIINSQRVVSSDSTQIMNLLCSKKANQFNSLFTMIEQSVNTLTVYASRQLTDINSFQSSDDYVDQYSKNLVDVSINTAENTKGAMAVYIRFNPELADPQSGFFCSKPLKGGEFLQLPPTNILKYSPTNKERVGWFYEPAQKKKGTWISPYYNKNIDVHMISYVVPFYKDNTFVGVVGMDIDFKVLKDIILDTKIYQSGYAYLADQDAKIVYHNQLESGTDLVKYNHGEFSSMMKILKSQESNGDDLIGYTYKGQNREAAFRALRNNMRLVLTAPTSEIHKQANTLILQIIIVVVLIVLSATIFTIAYTRRLVAPLLELNTAARKIADGDLSVTIAHHSEDEVGTLAESFRQTVAHLHKYISYINELAYRDPLTGVKNKTAYIEVVAKMDELTRLKRPQYALVVFDINGLKKVNDTLGHDFGDILITSACSIICRVFKRSPIYRIGGDEFVALLENHDYDHYGQLLEQFQEEIDTFNQNPDLSLKVSIARGIAIYSEETDLTYNDVFKRADSAMYRNKEEMKKKPPPDIDQYLK